MPCATRSRSLPPAKAAADQDLRYVAALRAYAWNADIAALAERVFRHCPQGRHVVLADRRWSVRSAARTRRRPAAVIFVPPVTAIRLRLRKLDRGALHLRCIKAFGAP